MSLIFVDGGLRRGRLRPGGDFEEIRWWPLEAGTVNRMPPGQARFIRETVTALVDRGRIDRELADRLLAATG